MSSKKDYRLLLRVIDNSKPILTKEDGSKLIPTTWIEHEGEFNFGSLSKSSDKSIIEFKLEPKRENLFEGLLGR